MSSGSIADEPSASERSTNRLRRRRARVSKYLEQRRGERGLQRERGGRSRHGVVEHEELGPEQAQGGEQNQAQEELRANHAQAEAVRRRCSWLAAALTRVAQAVWRPRSLNVKREP